MNARNVTVEAARLLRAEGPETLRYSLRTDAKTDTFEVRQVSDQACYDVLRDRFGMKTAEARQLMTVAETFGRVTVPIP